VNRALASTYTLDAAIGIIGLYILALGASRARTKRSIFGAFGTRPTGTVAHGALNTFLHLITLSKS
jgi:hypothetical protein